MGMGLDDLDDHHPFRYLPVGVGNRWHRPGELEVVVVYAHLASDARRDSCRRLEVCEWLALVGLFFWDSVENGNAVLPL